MIHLLYTAFVLAITGTLLDSITTYIAIKKTDSVETNIIATTFFKIFGIRLSLILLTCLFLWLEHSILVKESLSIIAKISLFCFIFVTKSAAAHNNYYSKSNLIVKAILLVPIYWNWKSIFNKIRAKWKQ